MILKQKDRDKLTIGIMYVLSGNPHKFRLQWADIV